MHESSLQLGYSLGKPEQEEVVGAFVQCRDVFVSVPTGCGKLLCYSLLLLVFEKIREDERSSIVIVAFVAFACSDD